MGQSLTKALEKNQALNYSDQTPQHSLEIFYVLIPLQLVLVPLSL
jgi:hypothetical protein